MDHSTKEYFQKLSEDPEATRRLMDFITTGGAAFFEEVRSSLSPQDLEDYLAENPDERIYLTQDEKKRLVR